MNKFMISPLHLSVPQATPLTVCECVLCMYTVYVCVYCVCVCIQCMCVLCVYTVYVLCMYTVYVCVCEKSLQGPKLAVANGSGK